MSPGTLYPALHRLERDGYLRREARVVYGRMRKYYVVTPKGGVALLEARHKIAELVAEVMDGETPNRERIG